MEDKNNAGLYKALTVIFLILFLFVSIVSSVAFDKIEKTEGKEITLFGVSKFEYEKKQEEALEAWELNNQLTKMYSDLLHEYSSYKAKVEIDKLAEQYK